MRGLVPCPSWLSTAEAIVFDKDGTLIDLDTRWAPFFRSAFTVVADGDPDLLSRFETSLGVDGDRLVPNGPAAVSTPSEILSRAHEVMEQAGWTIERRNDALARGVAAAEMGPLVAIGDIVDAMSRLVGKGIKVAIATSDARDNARAEISKLGIEPYISVLACGDDDVVKPDPEVLRRCGRDLGIAMEHIVYVGDSQQDQRTANDAGIPFIEVRSAGSDGLGCEVWVRSISEIADALDAG
ncbi:MAG: HAD family hydrolase [Acidimicrobiales bacterium]